MAVATYYFDGSDVAASDPNAVWSNDSNAFDNDFSTISSTGTNGSSSSNYLMAEGTNAPASNETINFVRFRFYSGNLGNGTVELYTDGLAETLANINHDSVRWSAWKNLPTPSGGWTWTVLQALECKAWKVVGTTFAVGIIELLVDYNSLNKPSNLGKLLSSSGMNTVERAK